MKWEAISFSEPMMIDVKLGIAIILNVSLFFRKWMVGDLPMFFVGSTFAFGLKNSFGLIVGSLSSFNYFYGIL
jgi:hypothetical protein